MPSSFKSLNLFGSGPHHFTVGAEGQLVLPAHVAGETAVSGSLYLGPLERRITVTGRLIAATDAALWALRDAITAQLLDPPEPGALIDHHGREWADMSFVEFRPANRTDRGRVVSLAYTATFIDFNEYP